MVLHGGGTGQYAGAKMRFIRESSDAVCEQVFEDK
jgi:hypothetical protein